MNQTWEAKTYERFLMIIGGQEGVEETKRARALLVEFNHFFPDAKAKWDEYCASMGLKV